MATGFAVRHLSDVLDGLGSSADCVDFDFDEVIGIDEAADFNHRGGWSADREELVMSFADVCPTIDVGNKESRSDEVVQSGSGFVERRFDLPQDELRLAVSVAD